MPTSIPHPTNPYSPPHPRQTPRRLPTLLIAVVLSLLLSLLTLTACATNSTTPPPGELGDNQQLLATCNPSAPPARFVAIDASGSSASDAITAERLNAVESVVRRTAVCSGYLRVIMFSGSSAGTAVLFDGSLAQDGATDNAKLKRVPEAVKRTMDTIRAGYGPAAAVQHGGSDIVGQYRLASEWIQQLGGRYQLHLTILTDGIQTVGVNLDSAMPTRQEAVELAQTVDVPRLPGASVMVAGLGRMAGAVPPSSVVEGLVTFYEALCAQTQAARCQAVTDYSTEGR